ncbi:MAG: hypothetical protein QME51_06780, partial [Planctomycetota bacterium]|nr:hypothetical protein [Planctomycetota bacterium]
RQGLSYPSLLRPDISGWNNAGYSVRPERPLRLPAPPPPRRASLAKGGKRERGEGGDEARTTTLRTLTSRTLLVATIP